MVHVTIDDETINCYHESLYDIYDKELSWVLSGEVPSLDGLSLKHAVDAYTIGKTLDQWRAINNLVLRRDRPLPPGRRGHLREPRLLHGTVRTTYYMKPCHMNKICMAGI